jgi:hypothetical protein
VEDSAVGSSEIEVEEHPVDPERVVILFMLSKSLLRIYTRAKSVNLLCKRPFFVRNVKARGAKRDLSRVARDVMELDKRLSCVKWDL